MLWIVTHGASHQIVSCNLHHEGELYSVWVERINGKGLKLEESKNKSEVELVRDAIDYAIKEGHTTLDLRSL